MLTTHLVWPKVLGITCAITSFGLLMSEVDVFWWRYAFEGDPAHIASWAFTLSFAALLVLSYPLYRGREWARRSVLILGGSLVLAAAVIEIIRGIGRMDAFGPLTGWVLVLFITRV